jgi:Pyridoxal-phosphate dependent enzyme
LDALPRLGLVREPTALFHAPRLSAAMGGPQLLFKRDDLLPVAFGGNKVRSLDLIVAEALRHGADTLVTGAGPLSNHVRASAGVAALTGLRWEIVHDDDISLAQRRREKMFDISAKHAPFIGPSNTQGAVPQGTDDCRRHPVAMRRRGFETSPARGPAMGRAVASVRLQARQRTYTKSLKV